MEKILKYERSIDKSIFQKNHHAKKSLEDSCSVIGFVLKKITFFIVKKYLCSKMQNMQTFKKTFPRPIDNLIKELEEYRLENRITQQQLADEIGVVFSTVSRWLNDKTKPNKIQQYHIEKFLKERGVYGKK